VGRPGLRKVHRYSVEFKLTAVKLSQMPGGRGANGGQRPRHPSLHAVALAQGSAGRRAPGPRAAGEPADARRAGAPATSSAEAGARAVEGRTRAFKKSHPVLFRTKTEIFAFIETQREQFAVSRLCELYAVTRAGYYAWRQRGPSARHRADAALLEQIEAIFAGSRGTYGSPRVHHALAAAGVRVSRRVGRLLRQAGLRARALKLYRRIPGLHGFFTSIPNRQLDRLATGPDQVWVGDIAYLKVGGAWRYLAVVMDRYSRRILGWSLSAAKDARLTLAALNRAVFHRRPRPGVIFHSDRGVEYAAYAFRDRLVALGFVQSMNRPREITDNAHMESFFHTMKSDAVHGVHFMHPDELERRLRSYIPHYNGVRLHSGIGYCSPIALRRRRGDP
jgi:putative transposase